MTKRRAKWLVGGLLALDVVCLLAALAFTNVTAGGPAQRSLGRSIAILTEVDALLDRHYAPLHNEAEHKNETTIALPDFPLGITFTPQEVTNTNREQFRALLLQRSAALLHKSGAGAFREGRSSEIESTSPQGAVRVSLDMLRPAPHRVFVGLTIVFALIATPLTVTLALWTPGWRRVSAVGVSLFAAALPFLIFAVALRFALRVAADSTDDYVTREFLQLGQELDWAAIRDSAIFAFGSSLLLITGGMLGRWSDTQTSS